MSKTPHTDGLSAMQTMYLKRFESVFGKMLPDVSLAAAVKAVESIQVSESLEEANAALIRTMEMLNYGGLVAVRNKDAKHRAVLMVTGDFNSDGFYEALPRALLDFLSDKKLPSKYMLANVDGDCIAVAVEVDATSVQGLEYQAMFNTGNTAVKIIVEEATNVIEILPIKTKMRELQDRAMSERSQNHYEDNSRYRNNYSRDSQGYSRQPRAPYHDRRN